MSENVLTACPDPACFPENADYRKYELKPCFRHTPKADGSEDALASLLAGELQFSGTADSEGATNRAYSLFQKKLRKEKRNKNRARESQKTQKGIKSKVL